MPTKAVLQTWHPPASAQLTAFTTTSRDQTLLVIFRKGKSKCSPAVAAWALLTYLLDISTWIIYSFQVCLTPSSFVWPCLTTFFANGICIFGNTCWVSQSISTLILRGRLLHSLFQSFTCPLTSRNARWLFHSISHEVLDAQTVKHPSAAGLISTPFHHRQSRWVLHHIGRQSMTISATGITKRSSAWVSHKPLCMVLWLLIIWTLIRCCSFAINKKCSSWACRACLELCWVFKIPTCWFCIKVVGKGGAVGRGREWGQPNCCDCRR